MPSLIRPLILLPLLAGLACAQEVDRAREPQEDRHLSGVAQVDSADPVRRLPTGPSYIPEEGVDPNLLPAPEPVPQDEGPRVPEEPPLVLDFEGRLSLGGGYDTNVFRSDRSPTDDGFSRALGELELTTKFAYGGELFMEVSADTLSYLERSRANEHYVANFVEYFHPITTWLDTGVQNALEFSELNLLNDNGDLVPRGRFGSLDEEVRMFLILRPGGTEEEGLHLRDLAFEGGVSFRDKNYEENSGVESLDYTELRIDGAISYRLSRRPRSRVKLKYRFRRRDYREFRARNRDGSVFAGFEPRLELQRHQLNLTWFQELDLRWFKGRVIAGMGATYNRDLFDNDRSYREASGSVRAEWWVVDEFTRVDLGLRAVARNFLARHNAAGGGRLRHRLLRIALGFEQVLGELPPPREGDKRDALRARFTFYVRATATAWRSTELGEDYDRYVVQAGVEVAW